MKNTNEKNQYHFRNDDFHIVWNWDKTTNSLINPKIYTNEIKKGEIYGLSKRDN